MASVFSLVPCILRVGRGAHGLLFWKRPDQLQTLHFLYLFTKMINLFGLFHERYQMDPYSSNEVVFKMSDSSEIVGIIVVYMTGDISVKSFAIFLNIRGALKIPTGGEALNENGSIPQLIHLFKDKYLIIVIYTKASLASYFSYGHEDNVRVNGIVVNNEIDHSLCRQTVSQTPTGSEAMNDNGLIPRSIRLLKEKYPDIMIYTDASLASYISYGRDDITRVNGIIMHNNIAHPLCKQTISQARAGADIISLSNMKDRSIGAIRDALDTENFHNVSIMLYTAKYQMDPFNPIEALLKMRKDSSEGADLVMVIPETTHMNVISYF